MTCITSVVWIVIMVILLLNNQWWTSISSYSSFASLCWTSPDLVSTSNLYRKPSHKIDLCPLFVSITFTSILTYNNRMSWTFLCSWTEFSHGKETFLPLAKMTIYRKNPRTHCMNLYMYIVSDFLNISIFFLYLFMTFCILIWFILISYLKIS